MERRIHRAVYIPNPAHAHHEHKVTLAKVGNVKSTKYKVRELELKLDKAGPALKKRPLPRWKPACRT